MDCLQTAGKLLCELRVLEIKLEGGVEVLAAPVL
jgi:hypothetical protein